MTQTNQSKFNPISLNLSEFCKGQFWQINPPAFEEMYRRLSQENTAPGLLQYAADMQSKTTEKDFYTLQDDVAIIPITGPLSKRAGFMSLFFGGTSYAFIQMAVKEALADDEVAAIVLNIDSPGGVVNGLDETVDLIYESHGQKPIMAYADGMMASAAYEIGSAADEVLAGPSSMIGSIGVLMVHEDWSVFNEKNGISVTYLTAGRYKALGNPDEPLSSLARDTFQAELDIFYTLFVEKVARNRDVDVSKVISDMADGRMFIGQQAADAGLVDKIGNFKLVLDQAQSMTDSAVNIKFLNPGGLTMSKTEINELSIELLQDNAPELLAQIQKIARDEGISQGLTQGYADGMTDERARVTEILGADAAPEQTRKAIEDGIAADSAYKQFYQAEKDKRAQGLDNLAAEASPVQPASDPDDPKVPKNHEQQRAEWAPVMGPAAS